MKRRPIAAATATVVAVAALASAGACSAAPEFSGQVRAEYFGQDASSRGPLATAAALSPGIAALPASGPELETELHASGHGLAGIVTLDQQRLEHDRLRNHAYVNELYGSGEWADWHFSAGKKIVGWDVGYGFRPNDVVAQEPRRTLLTTTSEGRPILMAEHFDATTAWSFVLVNPTKPREQLGAEEPALAMRVYQRDGAVDWHGFARYGAHTGASIGGAAAWVASESIELHGSVRYLNAADTTTIDPAAHGLVPVDPWRDSSVRHAAQALVGGTWTNADQISVLVEAWWDGTALSNAQWRDWSARNAQLAALIGTPAPAYAVAGNTAWQASAFNASTNLRRANLFARLSWTYDKWQPAIDMLYTPADAGRVLTAAIGWQGDRIRIDGGVRVYGGPSGAVLAQVPTRRTAYVAGTWSF
jgi:hypothetical protein